MGKLLKGTIGTFIALLGINNEAQAIIATGILGFIVGLLVLTLITNYKNFKKIVYRFVVLAEYYITGTKRGQERFDYVVKTIYDYIPRSLRFVLTEKRIKNIIEWAVREMKKALEKGIDVFDNVEVKIDEWKDGE